jgi:hypothetical protein
MTLASPIRITHLVAEIFDKLNIPYMVGGSLASSVHGIPRATQYKKKHLIILIFKKLQN